MGDDCDADSGGFSNNGSGLGDDWRGFGDYGSFLMWLLPSLVEVATMMVLVMRMLGLGDGIGDSCGCCRESIVHCSYICVI